MDLIVNSSLKQSLVVELVQKIRDSVVYIRNHQAATNAFRSYCNVGNIKELILDVPTRWWSKFDMIERFCILKEAVTKTLRAEQYDDSFFENETNWSKLNKMVILLSPFKEVQEILEGEKYVTISLVYPLINVIKKKLSSLNTSPFVGAHIGKLKQDLLQGLQNRFDFFESSYIIATYLDPRYKQTLQNSDKKWVMSKLSELIGSPSEIQIQEPPLKKNILQEAWSNVEIVSENKTKYPDEVNLYEFQKQEDQRSDILGWWKTKSVLLPNLSKIAKHYLCVPASSAAAERLFSQAGLIVSTKRCSILAENLEKILILEQLIKKNII